MHPAVECDGLADVFVSYFVAVMRALHWLKSGRSPEKGRKILPGNVPIFKTFLWRLQVQQFPLPWENLFALLSVLEREPHECGTTGDECGVDIEFLGLLVAQRLEGLVK